MSRACALLRRFARPACGGRRGALARERGLPTRELHSRARHRERTRGNDGVTREAPCPRAFERRACLGDRADRSLVTRSGGDLRELVRDLRFGVLLGGQDRRTHATEEAARGTRSGPLGSCGRRVIGADELCVAEDEHREHARRERRSTTHVTFGGALHGPIHAQPSTQRKV